MTTNPFSSRCVTPGAIKFIDDCDIAERIYAELMRRGWGQIVGPHGSGKTTLVIDVLRIAEQHGVTSHHCLLRDKMRVLPPETWDVIKTRTASLVVIDGFDQLSLIESLRVRCYSGILVTAHKPAWVMPVLYTTRPSLEVTTQVVDSILAKSMLPSQIAAMIPELHPKHHGNVRLILRDLYDIAEDFRQSNEEKTT